MSDYDHVYLSPHLDDVVFSCAGAIRAHVMRGERVLIVTMCTGAPVAEPAQRAEADLRPADMTAAAWQRLRCAEDELATQRLGADYCWLGELDAVYRLPDRYRTARRLFGCIAPGDPLPQALATRLSDLVGSAQLHAPLAIGRHVDHQVAHAAARAYAGDVLYYEDFPYAASAPDATARRLHELAARWQPVLTLITSQLDERIEAMRLYRSQLTLFPDEDPAALTRRYSFAVGEGVACERSYRLLPTITRLGPRASLPLWAAAASPPPNLASAARSRTSRCPAPPCSDLLPLALLPPGVAP